MQDTTIIRKRRGRVPFPSSFSDNRCYPNIDELLSNSSNASREYYSFILPRSDTKISSLVAKFIVSIGNLISRITSESRTYIHNLGKIDNVLTSSNFERVFRETSGMWLILIYRRITASRLSEERGMKERASFRRDDAAKAALPESEIVVLDKSMCCYPNIDELLSNSSNASREYYSFILPRSDTKISSLVAKFIVSIGNLISRITSESRTYIHNLGKIDNVLTSSNFERVFRETSGMWLILIYRRIP